ncbi:MAG: phosphatase PAP2 family protein [Chloroflexota bacterium]
MSQHPDPPAHRPPWTLAAGALAGFAVIAALVLAGWTHDLDLGVTTLLQKADSPAFRAFMVAVSAPGYSPTVIVVIALVVATLALLRAWRATSFAVLAACSTFLTEIVKAIVGRPRPTPDLVLVHEPRLDFGFPSGHTLFYTAFFGFLAYLCLVRARPRWPTRAVGSASLALVALIGPSRVWLGEHWVTDVAAAYLLGTAYLALVIHWFASPGATSQTGS